MSLILTVPYQVKQAGGPSAFSAYRMTAFVMQSYPPDTYLEIGDLHFIDTNGVRHSSLDATSFTSNIAEALPPLSQISDQASNTRTYWSDPTSYRNLTLEWQFSSPFTVDQIVVIDWDASQRHVQRLEVHGFDGTNWVMIGYVDNIPWIGLQVEHTHQLIQPGQNLTATNLISLNTETAYDPTLDYNWANNNLLYKGGTGDQFWRTDMTGKVYPTSSKLYAEVRVLNATGANYEGIGLASQAGILDRNFMYYSSGAIWRRTAGQTDTNVGSGTVYGAGDIISVLYDASVPSVSFWKNGVEVLPFTSWDISNAVLAARINTNPVVFDYNGGRYQFVYTPPAGFTGWGFG